MFGIICRTWNTIGSSSIFQGIDRSLFCFSKPTLFAWQTYICLSVELSYIWISPFDLLQTTWKWKLTSSYILWLKKIQRWEVLQRMSNLWSIETGMSPKHKPLHISCFASFCHFCTNKQSSKTWRRGFWTRETTPDNDSMPV